MPVGGIRLLAHRGASRNAPENTLEALALAREEGADGTECDVRLTADGEPILFHDEDARRVTGSPGRLPGMPWQEVRRLKVFGRCRVPHLDDALDFLAAWPGGELYLDLHEDSTRLVEAVVRRLDSGLKGRCYVLDFWSKRRLLELARRLDPGVRLAVMPGLPWNTVRSTEALGAAAVCLGWDGPWSRLLYRSVCLLYDVRGAVEKVRSLGAEVSGGIANTPADVRYLLGQGVGGIWTDDLPMARETLRS